MLIEKKEKFSEKVLERLAQVKQTPAWVFQTKNILFWTLWVVFVIFGGSLAVAAMAFHARFSGWAFYPVTHGSLWVFVLDTLPYVWLLVFVGFLFIGYENFKNTKHGYRYPFAGVVGASLLCCVFGGAMLYGLGVGEFVDEEIGEHLPFHHPALEQQRGFWQNPERGLLTGEIISVDTVEKTFVLTDSRATTWEVDGTKLLDDDWQLVEEGIGEDLRLLGLSLKNEENNFVACFVLLWGEEMRARGSKSNQNQPLCSNEECLVPPPTEISGEMLTPPEPILESLTTCEQLPGYEMIIRLKSEE